MSELQSATRGKLLKMTVNNNYNNNNTLFHPVITTKGKKMLHDKRIILPQTLDYVHQIQNECL